MENLQLLNTKLLNMPEKFAIWKREIEQIES